jgi:hypothetical protein
VKSLESEIDLGTGLTLFTPEPGMIELAKSHPLLEVHEHARSLVIGTSRDADSANSDPYAAFCVEPNTGHLVFVDLDPPFRTRFVNTDLARFQACLDVVLAAWPRVAGLADAEVEAFSAELRSELAAIDAAAVRDDDAFWPELLESLLI